MMELPNEDYNLIHAFLEHHPEAFDQLVLKHQNTVYNLCLRMLGNPDDAADCAQEIFIKVYKSLPGFRFQAHFSTWLYRISVNTCKNKLASLEFKNRRKTMMLDQPIDAEDNSFTPEIGDESNSPSNIVEKKLTQQMIIQAIQSLPTAQKTLIVLFDIEGYSYDEIAGITGLRMGTIKSRLARARHQLRGKLEGVSLG